MRRQAIGRTVVRLYPKDIRELSACQKLATGGAPQADVTEAEKAAALRYARCMRAHGVPNYPDPVFRNGRIGIRPPAGTDPNSPALLGAEKACGNP